MNETCEMITSTNELKNLQDIERSIQKKFRRQLWGPYIKALKEFQMVEEGDKIAVAISGGKDSLLMAKLFHELKRISEVNFEVEFISMNPGFNEINSKRLDENLKHLGINCIRYNDNIFEVAEKMAKDYPCYLCAKMRRGSLYSMAEKLGCNKLALGHHFDDVIETTLLNIFYAGEFKTMMPKLKSSNYNIELIRPLYYIKEKDIRKFTDYNGLNPMNCGCVVAAGKTSSKRKEIKELLKVLDSKDNGIKAKVFNSVRNVNLNQCISWKNGEKTYHFLDEY